MPITRDQYEHHETAKVRALFHIANQLEAIAVQLQAANQREAQKEMAPKPEASEPGMWGSFNWERGR